VRCSLPGRQAPHKCVAWAGAELDPHFANEAFKLNKGKLNLVNMPLAVDTSKVLTTGKVQHYADLRPEAGWANRGITLDQIASNMVEQLEKRDPYVRALNIVLHNDRKYWIKGGEEAKDIEQSILATKKACEDNGFELIGATLTDIVKQVHMCPRETTETTLVSGMYRTIAH